jgi:hypothetical protein
MSATQYRRWFAIGTGVGIEIDGPDLDITVVRVRPTGADVLGAMRIESFAARPAAEWGSQYNKFLKQAGGSHLAATVLLPRNDVIVRHLSMPGVSDRDLPQAIEFQLDGLHPFAEDEAVHSWSRMGSSGDILVGITRREVIGRYTTLFTEAGIKVVSFTFSAAILYSSLRILSAPPAGGFLAISEAGDQFEAYGESESRPMFSATFEAPNERIAERAVGMALAELRLPPETPALPVDQVIPKPKRAPEGFNFQRRALPYATAMAGACPRLALNVNLLPAELRATSSRAMFLPTAILGVLLIAGAGSLAAYSSHENKQYLEKLQAEIARLEPQARKPLAMDQTIADTRTRTLLLDQFRKRTQADLEVLNEVTKILEPPAWLNGIEITRDAIRMSGEAPEAAGLLRTIDQSPLFAGSEFAAPMSRGATGEVFAIRARRETQ